MGPCRLDPGHLVGHFLRSPAFSLRPHLQTWTWVPLDFLFLCPSRSRSFFRVPAPEWVKGGVQAKEGALQSLQCCTQTWGVRLMRRDPGGWVEVHQEVRGPQAGPLSAQACRRLACKNDGVWREGAGSSQPPLRWNRSKGALRGWAGTGCGAHRLQEGTAPVVPVRNLQSRGL